MKIILRGKKKENLLSVLLIYTEDWQGIKDVFYPDPSICRGMFSKNLTRLKNGSLSPVCLAVLPIYLRDRIFSIFSPSSTLYV